MTEAVLGCRAKQRARVVSGSRMADKNHLGFLLARGLYKRLGGIGVCRDKRRTDSAFVQQHSTTPRCAPQHEGVPLVALGGKDYGSGSSRDWAAKGTALLGVRVVIAESFERIHRSNLVGTGVLPLQCADGENASSLGLDGEEVYAVSGVADALNAGELPRDATVRAGDREFMVRVRIDTPKEAEYFRHGGILQYVLRQLLTERVSAA